MVDEERFVSIPFIAGQWSLPVLISRSREIVVAFQSPSLRGSGRFLIAPRRMAEGQGVVSIPFIAGQWSLQENI